MKQLSHYEMVALGAIALYIALGLAFIPHLGVQNDEALFGAVLYPPNGAVDPPFMLISYLGALKSWIYSPLFQIAPPQKINIRVPMLLAGAATIWLFFLWVRYLNGAETGLAAAVLLATDPMFLVTCCFDWGPTALQTLLVTGALLASGSISFIFLGLAAWNKAVTLWTLGGLAAGLLAAFPGETVRAVSWRRAAWVVVFFGLGALPLIIYNARNQWSTIRSNAEYDVDDLAGKAGLLGRTLDGSALFSWLVHEDWSGQPVEPRTAWQRASFRLRELTGDRQRGLMVYACLAALLLFPALGRRARRLWIFAVVYLAVTWLAMAVTKGAGGSVHHAVLLWPFPQFLVAVSFTEAARRWGRAGWAGLAVVIAALACSNLLVTNRYYALMIRNGGELSWTDAVEPLSQYLERVKAKNVFVTDWGIVDTLRLLNHGRLPLRNAMDMGEPRSAVLGYISTPDSVFVGHTEGNEYFSGIRERVQKIAQEAGYEKQVMARIADRNGRERFEVYRFSRRLQRQHRQEIVDVKKSGVRSQKSE